MSLSWHGQINRTLWELRESIKAHPDVRRYRRELLRAHFLQHFEYDRAQHVARDDRSFLFLHDEETPTCLLLHGAQGTPAEMRELGNYLYSKGYSVYCPRMARTDAKENMVSWESWVTQAENALETTRAFTRDVFVVGLSLGGTIAMILAQLQKVSGLVLLAPALYPRLSLKARFMEIARIATPTVFYRLAGWNGEVMKAMDHAKKTSKKIAVPVLCLQAADDRHLSHRGLKTIRKNAKHRKSEVRVLPHGSHVLTRGQAKDDVFTRIEGFLNQTKYQRRPRRANSESDVAAQAAAIKAEGIPVLVGPEDVAEIHERGETAERSSQRQGGRSESPERNEGGGDRERRPRRRGSRGGRRARKAREGAADAPKPEGAEESSERAEPAEKKETRPRGGRRDHDERKTQSRQDEASDSGADTPAEKRTDGERPGGERRRRRRRGSRGRGRGRGRGGDRSRTESGEGSSGGNEKSSGGGSNNAPPKSEPRDD